MSQLITIELVTQTETTQWQSFLQLYYSCFPKWQREPEQLIQQRISSGRYLLVVGKLQEETIGFYLLDIVQALNYAMLSYLAVAEASRSQGIGTLLCHDAIKRFHKLKTIQWLLVEAEQKQAIYYGRIGFLKLDFDYRVPHYNDISSSSMALMTITQAADLKSISAAELNQLITDIFLSGYQLNHSDQRLQQQLARLPQQVDLIPWPIDN